MTEIETNGDDFVDIVGRLTNFIQNERLKAYNEAVDMMLASARGWMGLRGVSLDPATNNLPDLLDLIEEYLANAKQPAETP